MLRHTFEPCEPCGYLRKIPLPIPWIVKKAEVTLPKPALSRSNRTINLIRTGRRSSYGSGELPSS